MKTKIVTRLAEEALREGPKTAGAIKDYINERIKYGTTRHSIVNVLSKSPKFKRLEDALVRNRYFVAVWSLV